MSLILRALLVICAALVLCFVISRIKRAKFTVSDSLFWLFASCSLLLIAVFPEIAFFFSSIFGFESPSNFVFLAVIALLAFRIFRMQGELCELRARFTKLVQEIAINTHEIQNQIK